jgi:DNA-binding transcriptional LysR family regulator
MRFYARRYHRPMHNRSLSRLANRLKLRHYALLVELARTRSVSRVAQQMSLSQPTVTRALAEIENIFGQPLFVRHRSGLEPTPAGVLVLNRARLALADAVSLEQDLEALAAGFRGRLRIGTIPFLSRRTQDAMWQHLLDKLPHLGFVVEEATTQSLLAAVKARSLDCAICRFVPLEPGVDLVQRLLYLQEPRLVASRTAAARLARRGLDWPALSSLSWVFPPVNTPIRTMIHAIFASAGQAVPTPMLETYAHKTLASVLRLCPAAITILPADIADEVADASGGRVLTQRLQWNLPPIGMARLRDCSAAQVIDDLSKAIRAAV